VREADARRIAMRDHSRHALLLVLTFLSAEVWAGLAVSIGPVANLRIEGAVAFIGLTNSMAGSSTCGSRVWVDLNTPQGRATYATALMLFNTKQPAWIRAFEESPRVFGECQLYDIYVPQ
jgi:hypothetical protein